MSHEYFQRVSEDISVAVWMVTYNHESYIAQAIDSVLSQQTNFRFKIFIGEDCSNDRTGEICQAYADRFSDRIALLRNSINIGAQQNGINTYLACFKSGARYVALLEGDDFWSNPYKLQMQFDFLEANKDFAICYHRVEELFVDGSKLVETLNTSLVSRVYSLEDLAIGNILHTPSVFFRNSLISEFPSWFRLAPAADYVLHLLNARTGKIYYMPDVMAVYRVGVGMHGSLGSKSKLYNWKVTLQYLLTMEWPVSVRNVLMERLRLTCYIIRRNKYKTLYKIRDTLVTFTGLRLIRKTLLHRAKQ